jgi:hypothetical protein
MNCPHKEECERGRSHGPGIYTVSEFYNPNIKECEFFIPVVKKEGGGSQ